MMNTLSTYMGKSLIKLASYILLPVLLGSFLLPIFYSPRASGLSGSDFDPGYIISDAVFYNDNAMSAAQIQKFLDAKLPACDTDGSESYSYHYRSSPFRLNNDDDPVVTTSRAAYGQRYYQANGGTKGSRAPYTCLKDFKMNTGNIAPSSGLCGGYTGASSESAATIIYKVAKSCDINPQVLLVTLQKEQSLITDDWPWKIQYDRAMGYSCPDPPPGQPLNCNAEYVGFFRQMYYGAYGFKRYKANPNNYNYRAGRNNTIKWHPNSSCGTSNVFIQNQATAALYIYTPYRPNQAALNNLYGTGNSCSSYGVRNFWRMFNDWFGSPIDPSSGYSAYRLRGPGSSSTNMVVGATKTVTVKYQNTGTQTWYDSTSAAVNNARPVILHAVHPNMSKPSGFNSAFDTPTRATQVFSKTVDSDGIERADPSIAHPGDTVEFTFDITSPGDLDPSKDYALSYNLVIPSGQGMPRVDVGNEYSLYHLYLSSTPTPVEEQTAQDTTHIDITNQAYSGHRLRGAGLSSTTMRRGTQKSVSILLKNIGTEAWYDIASATANNARPNVLMALHPSLSKPSGFNGAFATTTRATQRINEVYTPQGVIKDTTRTTRVVESGDLAKIVFTIDAPASLPPGTYKIAYTPVLPSSGSEGRVNLAPTDYFFITLTQ